MPQMKPMNWMILYLMMNLILLFMNIMNYFFIDYNNLNKNSGNKKSFMNWKW